MLVVQETSGSSPPAGQSVRTSVTSLGRACVTAFASNWVTVIAVSGQIDALNAGHVAECLHGFVSRDRALVLDFSGVGFLGAEILAALFALGDRCERLGIDWALVTSHAVRRLLRVGDPQRRLPAVGSMVEVLQLLRTARRRRTALQAVD